MKKTSTILFLSILISLNVMSQPTRNWGTYYGNPGDDKGNAVITDASGNVYITGQTASNISGISTAGAHQVVYGGGTTDAFLIKFNSAGVRQWGTYYGGTGDDVGYALAVDASGNVYLTGTTNSGGAISTAGAFQVSFAGSTDAFLVKFNSAGVQQWATYYGDTGSEER